MLNTIRNFAIIAHIDHGKTTLTDQLLKLTGTISKREQADRILDSNPIEKERGITIKLAPVTMPYTLDAKPYTLNLIDTPGHVDFSYEVSRSLSACEGAILLVDATQGIQAQTLSNAKKAVDLGLMLLPVINKTDLPSADVNGVSQQLMDVFGFKEQEIILVSAKTGNGVEVLLEKIIKELPPPPGNTNHPLKALIFNSIYDMHLGVIAFVRIMDGKINYHDKLLLMAEKKELQVKEIGIFKPQRKPLKELNAGEVGYIATGLKDIKAIKVGDTISGKDLSKVYPLPGFKFPKPVVFADFYPTQDSNFNELKNAIEKLQLTDASLTVKQIHSPALGGGFRLGFLGLFHIEITRERLQREQAVDSILTKPTVEYTVITNSDEKLTIQHPSELPDPSIIKTILEPITEVSIFTPKEYLGSVYKLLQTRRGKPIDTQYLGNQVQITYSLPLVELITGFVDELKSVSQGFASLDYTHLEPKPVDAVKLKVLINHEEVEPLSRIVVRQQAQSTGKEVVTKLKEYLPRQMFAVPIQAAIGGEIIARETKPAARKDVTAKLYGGDRTRRMKLLEKQKKGKKKMALLGKVNIPPDTFTKLMKI